MGQRHRPATRLAWALNAAALLYAASGPKCWAQLIYVSVHPDMHRTPDDLRELATHCRYLASSCLTQQARQPLNEIAEELEIEADRQQQVRQQLIGSGRH
jgi:hypothetical protein